jgi:FlaG/FlaF family flagellin (archaellin)
MSAIVNALNAGIYTKLTGGTALTTLLSSGTSIYYEVAPNGEVPPYVVWSYAADNPLNWTKSDLRETVAHVRGYASSRAMAGSIDAQIDAQLNKGSITVTGFVNISTLREQGIYRYWETATGFLYEAGAFYRVRLDD